MSATVPTGQQLDRAQEVVARHLLPTPLVSWSSEHGNLMLKLETVQPSGSFKVRGALCAMSEQENSGDTTVTASAGNHALGIAEAARILGRRATIVLPATASTAKVEALRRYDVDLRLIGSSFEDAEAEAMELAQQGMAYVSAYNHNHVIAGQSTMVAELAQQFDGPMTVVVPVGGGGLVAGTALEAARHGGRIRVIGVEVESSMAVSAAVQAGATVPVSVGDTIADGLAGNIEQACVTPDIIRASNIDLVSVAERTVRQSVRILAARAGIVVEGAAAVVLAAVLEDLVPLDRSTVLALTGRNIALPLLQELIA